MIFPLQRQKEFYDLLDRQAELVQETARALRRLVHDYDREKGVHQSALEIRELEHRGDALEEEMIHRLHSTFVTPLDREDLFALTAQMEMIIDVLDGVAERLDLYDVQALIPEITSLADDLERMTECLVTLVAALKDRNQSRILEHARALKAQESEMDRHYRSGVARLFRGDLAALEVLKLKEICEHLEEASDHCEKVADLVEGIAIKYA